MEECPDGNQHFISPNPPAAAQTALFAVKDGKRQGGNYYCHVYTGNTGLHPGFSCHKHYTLHTPQKKYS